MLKDCLPPFHNKITFSACTNMVLVLPIKMKKKKDLKTNFYRLMLKSIDRLEAPLKGDYKKPARFRPNNFYWQEPSFVILLMVISKR